MGRFQNFLLYIDEGRESVPKSLGKMQSEMLAMSSVS